MPDTRTLVATSVAKGEPSRLLALLQQDDPDHVMHLLAAELGRAPLQSVLVLAARLSSIEDTALRELKARERIGALGATERTLQLTVRRAGEARLRILREMGQRIDALPEDKGGRRGPNDPVPPRREVRKDLGLTLSETAALVKLSRLTDDTFDRYTARIREGELPPKTTESIVRKAELVEWSSDEYYTPIEILEAARRALRVDQFSCDPYSNLAAQAGLVRAERWYGDPARNTAVRNLARPLGITERDLVAAEASHAGLDGNVGSWGRRWWANPPFADGKIEPAHEQVEAERRAGSSGILLVNCDTGKEQQQSLLRTSPAVFLASRTAFWSPCGERRSGNRHTQVLYGINVPHQDMREAFEHLGATTQPA